MFIGSQYKWLFALIYNITKSVSSGTTLTPFRDNAPLCRRSRFAGEGPSGLLKPFTKLEIIISISYYPNGAKVEDAPDPRRRG